METGMKYFVTGEYVGAVKEWCSTLRSIETILARDLYSTNSVEYLDVLTMKKRVLLNLTLACMKLNDWSNATQYCQQLVSSDPKNSKGIYRMALIHAHMNNPGISREWVEKGVTLYPDDIDFQRLPARIKAILGEFKKREAHLWKGKFIQATPTVTHGWGQMISGNLCCRRRKSQT